MGSIGKLTPSSENINYDLNTDEDIELVPHLDPRDYKNDEYASFLASAYTEGMNSGKLYEYIHDTGDQAFAAVDFNFPGNYVLIDSLGSTGGGAGTELLLRVMEHAVSSGKGLHWGADNPDSMSYYTHLGLDKYGHEVISGRPEVGKQYYISDTELQKEYKRLRKKR